MQKVEVQTKNGGKITVEVYDSLQEAVKRLTEKEVLKNLNRIIRIDLVNEANRKQSITAKLKKAVKAGKVTEAQLVALLAKANA